MERFIDLQTKTTVEICATSGMRRRSSNNVAEKSHDLLVAFFGVALEGLVGKLGRGFVVN